MNQESESVEAKYASNKAFFDEKLQKLRANLIKRCQTGERCGGDNPYYHSVLKALNASRDQVGSKRGRSQEEGSLGGAGSSSSDSVPKPSESASGLSWRRVDWDRVDEIPSVEEQLRLYESAESQEEKDSLLLQALQRPTAGDRERILNFQSVASAAGLPGMRPYCPHLTKERCAMSRDFDMPDDDDIEIAPMQRICTKLHFTPIRRSQTDEKLGNCSYLNTCRNLRSCRYLHYELDPVPPVPLQRLVRSLELMHQVPRYLREVRPRQWVNCDVRKFDMSILGKFGVIMTDPPWEIHQDLPYGTMEDDEMVKLDIGTLQDEGVIFMWVTGRALELGRECLRAWGYNDRVDELIWVKTNQLQQLIRTGRTGHWLNHTKEHCLVGIKGNPKLNRYVDCDVLVSEVRETSQKPDEMYRLLERLSPGSRKIEVFARKNNLWDGWLSLGNQLDDVCIVEPDLRERFIKRYGVVPEVGKPLFIGKD